MLLQAVIMERIILSALITLVVAIASCPFSSSINGFGFLERITPLAELEGLFLDEPLNRADYRSLKVIKSSIRINSRFNLKI